MSKQKKILLGGGLVLLIQLYFFRDHLFPIQWGQIKVSGLACTCPDERVVSGQLYLKNITPDSLIKYDLDYSEIYVTDRPSTDMDPIGVDIYIIKGQVIDKKRVSEGDPWNPVVRVDKWREVDILNDWVIKGFFFSQLIVFGFVLWKTRNINGA